MNTLIKDNQERAVNICHCLKGLAHEIRLMILSSLRTGEKGVNELSDALGYPQPTISQHLAKMRERGLVIARREGTQIYYSIADKRMFQFLDLLKELFCKK